MQNKFSFVKYHSLENDFIICQGKELLVLDFAQSLCNRHSGVGADGIILYDSTIDPMTFTLLIQNADGSDGGFSGNGVRCLAAHLFEKYELNQVTLKTKTKEMHCFKKNDQVFIKIGLGTVLSKTKILLDQQYFDGFYVDVGNPHLLFLSTMNKSFFLEQILEIKKQLILEQNISLIESIDGSFFITTYERGVGLTRGCSSAALAFLTLLQSSFCKELSNYSTDQQSIDLFMLGGKLSAEYDDQSVELKAQAFSIFDGSIKK